MWIQEAVLLDRSQSIHDYRDIMWRNTFDFQGLSRHVFQGIITTDGVAVSVHFQRPKRLDGEETHLSPEDLQQERVISIDPGRVRLVTACERRADGRFKFYSISRKGYYASIRASLERMRRWEVPLQVVNDEFSACSIRTSNRELCSAYRRVYYEWYDRLWAVRFHKKLARERFHMWSSKMSVIDRFFASFTKEDHHRLPIERKAEA